MSNSDNPELTSELTSMMFADVKGYSKLDDHQLKKYFSLVLPAIANILNKHKVRGSNSWGDGVVGTFQKPNSAARCALKIRDYFNNTNWAEEGLPDDMSIRIGLHTATVHFGYDPIQGRPGMVGSQVNMTARIEPIVPPGHVYCTKSFFHTLQSPPDKKIGHDPIGCIELAKGWPEEDLYNIRWHTDSPATDMHVDSKEVQARIIAPHISKIEKYVGKRFKDPDAIFGPDKGTLSAVEKRTLDIIKNIKLMPGKSLSASVSALPEIAEDIKRLIKNKFQPEKRKFAINFFNHYTRDMTISEFLAALDNVGPHALSTITTATVEALLRNNEAELISARDMFAQVEESVKNQCMDAFHRAGLLVSSLSDEDHEEYVRLQHPPTYSGIDPLFPPGSALWKEMRAAQESMKTAGAKIVKTKCSKTHVVMSYALGEWDKSNSPNKYMVITATNSDKERVLLPSETPIVQRRGKKSWLYYGDSSKKPSSEFQNHWRMHERLASLEKWKNCKCILHPHIIQYVNLSNDFIDKDIILVGDDVIPNIPWELHGTPKLGDKIIDAIKKTNQPIVIVKKHGPWVIAPTMLEATTIVIDKLKDVNLELKGKKPARKKK